MTVKRCGMTGLLLIAGIAVADAAPNIPPSELPGRERERFVPSPVDRFTDPFAWPRTAEPLWRWCDEPTTKRGKQRKRPKRNQAR